MKKTYRSFFCLLAVLLLSVSALPAASALFSERLYYYGTVEEISRAADGTVESVLVTAEGQETYEMVITERTQWQDHDEKTTSDPATPPPHGAPGCLILTQLLSDFYIQA